MKKDFNEGMLSTRAMKEGLLRIFMKSRGPKVIMTPLNCNVNDKDFKLALESVMKLFPRDCEAITKGIIR